MRPDEQTLERYPQLRATQRALNEKIVATLPRRAIEETARRLGLWSQGRLLLDYEEDVGVLYDAAIYDYSASGVNAVSRYAARRDAQRSTDETLLLRAMSNAYVTVVELVESIAGVGARVYDVLADR